MCQALNYKIMSGKLSNFLQSTSRIYFKGFKHEHTRSDRDRFVEINFENIKKGHESNFKKCGYCNNQRLPYDTGSVMHYSSYSFSKNGKPTIIVKDGSGIGQRNGFSLSDLKGINDLYCSHLSYNSKFRIFVRSCLFNR